MPKKTIVEEPYGNPAPFAEPAWYNSLVSPYYGESHARLREHVRKYLAEHVVPHLEDWEENGHVPDEARLHYARSGLAFQGVPPEYSGDLPLSKIVPPQEWDIFHSMVISHETARIGYAGVMVGMSGGTAIGLPPIVKHGTDEQMRQWLPGIFTGETTFCLGATEPSGGSDLANLKTVAQKTEDGKTYVVNGHKKWITGAIRATHMTAAVRTGGPGITGVSMLVIPLNLPGVTRRKMKNSGWNAADTTWVTFEDVRVPVENLLGSENSGFQILMTNFNAERFAMAVQMNSQARICLEDAWQHALDRQTFGKPLFSHQIIRHKLANLARYIESHWAWIEQIAYHVQKTGEMDSSIASRIALAKVHAGRLLELACREAQQVFGGLGFQRGGIGGRVEQISRDLRVYLVGGGSEEIITDLAIRQETAQAAKRAARL